MNDAHGDCYIASAHDGTLQPIDVDLCIRLLFRGVGKADDQTIAPSPTTASITAHPNPFNPTTEIAFDVPAPATVKLSIYSVSGRVIRSLVHEELAQGGYLRSWDGRDDNSRAVSAGVYIAKLEVAGVTVSQRLVLLK